MFWSTKHFQMSLKWRTTSNFFAGEELCKVKIFQQLQRLNGLISKEGLFQFGHFQFQTTRICLLCKVKSFSNYKGSVSQFFKTKRRKVFFCLGISYSRTKQRKVFFVFGHLQFKIQTKESLFRLGISYLRTKRRKVFFVWAFPIQEPNEGRYFFVWAFPIQESNEGRSFFVRAFPI